MAVIDPQISIIMPSFRDARILEAIASVRAFDDVGGVRIIVIDGGSSPKMVDRIAAALDADDILVSEKDRGIFDALNKGLDQVTTPYLGWLGSDDFMTGDVMASDVVTALRNNDLFIASTVMFSEDRVLRKTHAWPAAHGLARFGLHNPHYSTFGRTSLLGAERFVHEDIAADIDYFLRIFARRPHIAHTDRVALLMAAGGFSNRSMDRVIKVNRRVFTIYRSHTGALAALAGIAIKAAYKVVGAGFYVARRRRWRDAFPRAAVFVQPVGKAAG